jgi:tRNA(adenine34) deaminase
MSNFAGQVPQLTEFTPHKNGLVAQLDRATDYESVGYGFESLRARFFMRGISRLGVRVSAGPVFIMKFDKDINSDASFLKEAIKEAKLSEKKGEVPVGAVIVLNNKIIGRGHNQSITLNDPSAHAEIIALKSAAKKLKNYRLIGSKIYVTIEPCAMCAGALVWARVSEIVFGAYDKKAGACGSIFNIVNNKKLNHRIKIKSGILKKECGSLIQNFFQKKRK